MKQISKIQIALISLLICCASCFSKKTTAPELLNYTSSECKDVYFKNLYKFQNRIISSTTNENLRTYNLFVVANCNKTAIGKIELNKDTLNFIFQGKQEYRTYKHQKNDSTEVIVEEWIEPLADCDCAFNISYQIKGLDTTKNYWTTLNGKRITNSQHKFKIIHKTPSYKLINKDTINYIDIYGLKQGLHITFREDGKLYSKINYTDNQKISGLVKTYYNLDGFDKIEIFMKNKAFTVSKYYKNSELIKICDTDGFFADGTNCKFIK